MNSEPIRKVQPEVIRYLEFCRKQLELEAHQTNVLDFGCGNGRSTLELIQRGYNAVGVDIDNAAIMSGRALLATQGIDGEGVLHPIESTGRLPFPDRTFDFVFSQEVFEHVEHLDAVTDEIARVMAPGGFGFHLFRPQFAPVEPHFFMPFVHWLPKNSLRKYAIAACACLGIGGHPPQIPDAGPLERADFLYHYSVEQTFYRPYRSVGEAFRRSGLDVCFVTANHRKLSKLGRLHPLIEVQPVANMLGWTLMTFYAVHLLTRAPDPRVKPSRGIQMDMWTGQWLPARPTATEGR